MPTGPCREAHPVVTRVQRTTPSNRRRRRVTTTAFSVPTMHATALLLLLLPLLLQRLALADDTSCPMNVTEPAPDGARLVDGVLLAAGSPERRYPPHAYRPAPGGSGRYVLCTCATERCLRKCCQPGMAYGQNNKCTSLNGTVMGRRNFTVPKFVNASGTIEEYESNHFRLVHGKIKCTGKKYQLNPRLSSNDSYRVNDTGWLLRESGLVEAQPGHFCLEQSFGSDFYTISVVCTPDNPRVDSKTAAFDIKIFYTIGMFLSLPFLLVTFLVYALIKDLRNLHGKSLMCHVATLMMAYICLIISEFIYDSVESGNVFCIVLGFTCQFSFIASFFWLNVMCFDLWWTFSGFRPVRGIIRNYEAKKFMFYSIYAWGCSTLILTMTLYMDLSPNVPSGIVRPGIGKHSCWFNSDLATLLYFYGPIGILLFSNLLMFIHTAIKIVKHMNDARVFSGSESNRNVDREKQRFVLYLKLFIVMGVNWLAEIISWSINSSSTLWYVTDIGNTLQGVLIFLIFVCKRRVLKLLNEKLCPHFVLFKTTNFISTKSNSIISRSSRSSSKNRDSVEMNAQSPRSNPVVGKVRPAKVFNPARRGSIT